MKAKLLNEVPPIIVKAVGVVMVEGNVIFLLAPIVKPPLADIAPAAETGPPHTKVVVAVPRFTLKTLAEPVAIFTADVRAVPVAIFNIPPVCLSPMDRSPVPLVILLMVLDCKSILLQ